MHIIFICLEINMTSDEFLLFDTMKTKSEYTLPRDPTVRN